MKDPSGFLREYAPVNLGQYVVDDLIISCSDHRFRHAFRAVVKNRDMERADEITVPAPSKSIASGLILPHVVMLHEFHDFSNVHILDHPHCGGFQRDYDGEEDEKAMTKIHERKLEAAAEAIHQALPHITVVTYVVGVEEVISTRSFSHVPAD